MPRAAVIAHLYAQPWPIPNLVGPVEHELVGRGVAHRVPVRAGHAIPTREYRPSPRRMGWLRWFWLALMMR